MRRETEIPRGQFVGDTHVDPAPLNGKKGKATPGVSPKEESPSPLALPDILTLLKETHRQREDLMRPELGLQRQIKAIARREAAARKKKAQPSNGSAASHALLPNGKLPRDSNGGRRYPDTQNADAPSPDSGRINSDTHSECAADSDAVGRDASDTHIVSANGNSTVFFATVILDQCRAVFHRNRLKPELRMKKLAKQLPVWEWVKTVPGFGELGLAQIIAETGDLDNYDNPGKVWKRLGLAVAPDGGRQRKVKDKVKAKWMGYSPRRRSMMFSIGESAIKKQGYYREVYLARKEYEKATTECLTLGQYHARARRYMEKRFIKHLWQQWRKQPITD